MGRIKINIPKDELRSLYEDQELSSPEIAQLYKIDPTTIRRRLTEYNISIRTMKESKNTAKCRLRDSIRNSGEGNPNYKDGRSPYVRRKVNGKSAWKHRVLAQEWLGRALLPKGIESTHHRSGDRKDNTPTNIIVMDARDHGQFHALVQHGKLDLSEIGKYSYISFSRGGIPIIPDDYLYFFEHFVAQALQRRGLKYSESIMLRMKYMIAMRRAK